MQKCIMSIVLLVACLSHIQAEQPIKKVVNTTTINKVVNPGDQRLLDAINSLTDYISTLESQKGSETIVIIQDLFTQMSSWNIDLQNIYATITRLLESIKTQNSVAQQDIISNIQELKTYFGNINDYQERVLTALSSLEHMSVDPNQLAYLEASQRQLIALTRDIQNAFAQQSEHTITTDHLEALHGRIDQLHLNGADLVAQVQALSSTKDLQPVFAMLETFKKHLDSNAQQTAQMLQAISNTSVMNNTLARTMSGLQESVESIKDDVKKVQLSLEQSTGQQHMEALGQSLYDLQGSHDTLVSLVGHLPPTASVLKELTATLNMYAQSITDLTNNLATQESSDTILRFVDTLKSTLDGLQDQQNDLVTAFNALANVQRTDAIVLSLNDIKKAVDQTNKQVLVSLDALVPQQSDLKNVVDNIQNNVALISTQSATITNALTTYDPQAIMQSISALKDALFLSSQTLINQFETVVASSSNPQIISQLTSLQNQVTILKASLDQSAIAVNNLITINSAQSATLNNQITSLNNVLSATMFERIPIATTGVITSPGSYYLVNDLNNVGGITIAASNVILDLNNHAIANTDQALVIQDGINNVKISQGHIYNIAQEAILIGSNTQSIHLDSIHITNVAQTSQTAGVYCKGTAQFAAQHNIFKNLHIKNANCGIALNNTYNTLIEHCHITQSTQTAGASGIMIVNDTATDANNVISDCKIADIISTTSSAVGILLVGSSKSCVSNTVCKNIIGVSYAYGYHCNSSAGMQFNECGAYNIHALDAQAPAFGVWIESSAYSTMNSCVLHTIGSLSTPDATNGALLLSNSSYSALNNNDILNVEGTKLSFGICTYNSSQVHINNACLSSIHSSGSAAGIILGGDHPSIQKCSIDTINGDMQAYGVYVSSQNGIPSALSLSAAPLNGAYVRKCFVQNVYTSHSPSTQAIGFFVNTIDGTYIACGARDITVFDATSQAQGMYSASQSINTIFEECRVQNIASQAQGFSVSGTGIYLNKCSVNAIEGEGIFLSNQAHNCLVNACLTLHCTAGIANQSADSEVFDCLSSSNMTNYSGVNRITPLGAQRFNKDNTPVL